jgi:flagellar biosynthesis protein FlhA
VEAAGAVIKAFGQFVWEALHCRRRYLPHPRHHQLRGYHQGAGRVAEVAARFTLDAMPGKQMAIDADLSSESSMKRKRGRDARK